MLVGIFDPNLRGLRFPFGLITLYYTIMDLIVGWYVVIWTHVMWFRPKTQKSVINRACKVDITFCIWNAPLAYLVVAIQAKKYVHRDFALQSNQMIILKNWVFWMTSKWRKDIKISNNKYPWKKYFFNPVYLSAWKIIMLSMKISWIFFLSLISINDCTSFTDMCIVIKNHWNVTIKWLGTTRLYM